MLALAHVRMRMLSLLRTPAYVVGTLALPSLILVFLGVGLADTVARANAIMGSFTVFAVMGIAFFQFGVGIAENRASAWSTFERILPAPMVVRLAGAVIPAVLFAAVAAGLVVGTAHIFMPVALGAGAWLRLALVLVAGSIPLALFGIAIGYCVSSRAALPVANIIYLGLAFGGGAVRFSGALPRLARRVLVVSGDAARRRAGVGVGARCAVVARVVGVDRRLCRRRLVAGRLGISPRRRRTLPLKRRGRRPARADPPQPGRIPRTLSRRNGDARCEHKN